ncbi:hypothetical protein OBV_02360 [Oscillibacter valericigenes Sjm18-20]|nr:hypothetical protein OBV_02360 [Oscillibacter valericigenes Sjm18-20]
MKMLHAQLKRAGLGVKEHNYERSTVMSFQFSDETLRALARAIEYYLVHYVDELEKTGNGASFKENNAAASEEDYRLREIINAFDLKRFFDTSTLMRF